MEMKNLENYIPNVKGKYPNKIQNNLVNIAYELN